MLGPRVGKVGVPVLFYYNAGTVQPINRPPSSVALAVNGGETDSLYYRPGYQRIASISYLKGTNYKPLLSYDIYDIKVCFFNDMTKTK